MATNILALPLYTFPITVRTNEDWLDAWAYVDGSGNAISLAGLSVSMMVRPDVASHMVALIASTDPVVASLPNNGGIVLDGNKLGLSVLSAAMGRVPPGSYVFEVFARGDGVGRVIAAGPFTVLQGVVR